MHRPVRVLGVPPARAAVGGNLIPTASLRRVVPHEWRRTSPPGLLSCRSGERIQEHVRPLDV